MIKDRSQRCAKILIMISIIFVAFNLTTPFASVGPLINIIRTDLGLSHVMVSFVNTLPILLVACFAPFASKIGTKIGTEVSIFGGLILIAIGMLIRGCGNITNLFAGTALLGIGVATGNTLVPSVLKKHFPNKINVVSGIYTTAITSCSALSSAISVPLAVGLKLGWRKALEVWAIVTLIAIVMWIPRLRGSKNNKFSPDFKTAKPLDVQETKLTFGKILCIPLAWGISLFMGLECFNYNGLITWIPAIMKTHGMNEYNSGLMLALFQIISMPASLITPLLFHRFKDQRGIAVVSSSVYLIGFIGLLFCGNNALIVFWIVLMGLGCGAVFSLTVSFMAMRASNIRNVALLTGMVQSVGNFIGALGPFSIGLLFDVTKSWTMPIILFIIVTVGMGFSGAAAGRNTYIDEKNLTL